MAFHVYSMMTMLRFLILTTLCIYTSLTFADAPRSSIGSTLLPIVFYTPDTQTAIGGAAFFYFRDNPKDDWRMSSVKNFFTYTQKRQMVFHSTPEVYVRNGEILLRGGFGLISFPGSYYGIGSSIPESSKETFHSKTLKIRAEAMREVFHRAWIGAKLEFSWQEFSKVRSGGLIEHELIDIGEKQRLIGVGPSFRIDHRNSALFPTDGFLFETNLTAYAPELQSELKFNRFLADFHKYFPIGASNVIATKFNLSAASNGTPFYQRPFIGGTSNFRGYMDGRYRGDVATTVQAEYRHQLSTRWGFAVFSGLGSVFGPKEDSYRIFPAGGGGMRYAVDVKERLNFRLDLAFGKNSSGVYFLVGEAF